MTLAPIVAGSSSSPPPPPPPPTGGVVVIEVAELRRDATKARHWYLRAVQLGFDAGAVAAALSSLFSIFSIFSILTSASRQRSRRAFSSCERW